MKKFIATLLSLLMLVSVFSSFAVLSEAASTIWVYDVDKTTNASSQRQKIAVTRANAYSISYSGTSAGASADDGSRLTDGNAGTADSYLSVFNGSGTTTIVINLGYKAIGMTDFYARFYKSSSSGYNLPTSVQFYVSNDGSAYNYAGESEELESVSDNTSYSLGFTKNKGCEAQYIKFEINQSGTVACAEVAAYIWADVTTISATGAADNQGLVYSANTTSGTAYVTSYTDSYTTTTTVQGSGITPASANGKVNGITYTIGTGSADQSTVITDFMPSGKANRPGIVNNNKKYIVMHTTGNFQSTAKNNHDYQTKNSSCTGVSWHYTVGDHIVYQGLPDNETAWHAADGTYGKGNYSGIGIETSDYGFSSFTGSAWTNFINNYFYAHCRTAAVLVAELCIRWNLDPGDCSASSAVIQHADCYEKNCPYQMRYNTSSGSFTRNTGDMWVYFKGYVDKYYTALKGGGTYEQTVETPNSVTNVEVPQYVYVESSKSYCRVTGIAGSAFASKKNLVSVYLPSTITWGSPSFASDNLVDINVSPACTYYYSKGGVLYSAADNSVVATPAKNKGTGTIKVDPAVYGIANFTLGEEYSAKYDADTDKKLLRGFYNGGATASALKGMFVDSITVCDAEGNAVADGATVGTGAILKSEDGEETCTLIVYGDLDGDAKISATDYVVMSSYLMGGGKLSGAYFLAAAIGNGETVSTSDLLHLEKKISG